MSEPRTLDAVARQVRLADETAHRPWPLPDTPWSQAQTRRDALLLHWRVELMDLVRRLPQELPVDTFDGEAWVQLAAYRVESLRIRGLPPVPGLSSFAQLEVSTYVVLGDRPGVWLFSVDVTKQLLAEAAKRAHRLPAYRARISVGEGRVEASRDGLELRARYESSGEPFEPAPGGLDSFLTGRYALYTEDGGRLYCAELHHSPARLRAARASVEAATLSPVPLDGEPYALSSELQDLLVWPLEEL